MPLPIEIQNALRVYDNNKGIWRRLFRRDQAAIRALRRLSDADQANLLKINQCFIENSPKITQESYKVFSAVAGLNPAIPEVMNELYSTKLLKYIDFDILNTLDANQFKNLASIVKNLNNAQLLTRQNLTKIGIYYEAPEKLSIIAGVVNTLTEADRLKQEDFNEISELLKELYHNQLLTQENTDHLVHLLGNNIRVLSYLLRTLSLAGLLTQDNFDVIQTHLITPEYIGILASAVDLFETGHCLNQENLNSLFKIPMYATNIASALMVLDQTELLTSTNRSKLLDAENLFLLSNEAYILVWHPLKTYLPQLANVDEQQSVFDHVIDLAQQEDPAKKIKNYMHELTDEFHTPRPRSRVYTNDSSKFSTAPAKRINSRSSLVDLIDPSLSNRPGTL